jgi:hypothetical protein
MRIFSAGDAHHSVCCVVSFFQFFKRCCQKSSVLLSRSFRTFEINATVFLGTRRLKKVRFKALTHGTMVRMAIVAIFIDFNDNFTNLFVLFVTVLCRSYSVLPLNNFAYPRDACVRFVS